MLHSVDKVNYRVQKVYFVVLLSKLSLSISHILALRYIACSHIAWRQVSKGGASPKFFYAFWLETEKVKYFASVCWSSGFSIFL